MMKGIIALDIDGTTIYRDHTPQAEDIEALKTWQSEGWTIVFITGRSLAWAEKNLGILPFSYAIAPQNGALLIEFPTRKVLFKRYIKKDLLNLSLEYPQPIIYLGDEAETVYWNPLAYPEALREYLIKRFHHYQENWIESNEMPAEFALLKWFGTKEDMQKLGLSLEQTFNLHCPAIRDPYNGEVWIALATSALANKGEALRSFRKIIDPDRKGFVIAAGDDYNDILLLQAADVPIAMASAPDELKEAAVIIAENGLKDALEKAIKRLNQG